MDLRIAAMLNDAQNSGIPLDSMPSIREAFLEYLAVENDEEISDDSNDEIDLDLDEDEDMEQDLDRDLNPGPEQEVEEGEPK